MIPIEELRYIVKDLSEEADRNLVRLQLHGNEFSSDTVLLRFIASAIECNRAHEVNMLLEVVERLDAINTRNERVEKYMIERDHIYDERMSKYDDWQISFKQTEADSSPTVNVAGEPMVEEYMDELHDDL